MFATSNSKAMSMPKLATIVSLTFLAGIFLGLNISQILSAQNNNYASHVNSRMDTLCVSNQQQRKDLALPPAPNKVMDVSSDPASKQQQKQQSPPQEEEEGWKHIHVFYGDRNHLEEVPPFSQFRQDEIVAGLLHGKRRGFFVDLAAHQATYISNTYILERDWDWTGLCIEANSEYWRGLSYRKCEVVAAVVGKQDMQEVEFQTTHDGALGGIEGHDFKNKPGRLGGKPTIKYYTVSFPHVLDRMKVPKLMDYLSLDVEGAEYFVMEAFPFDSYGFRIMTIEQPNQKLVNLLQQHSYEMICRLSSEETLWVLTSEKASMDLSAAALPASCRK